MSVIGMMDSGYFVPRKEVVDWINDTLKLNLSKIEQTASGAVACQLLDRIYPGKVPMHKVNFEAKQDYEFINNYKVLQDCFTKLRVDKHIDVEKLIRAKYQDNFEFMQWFKRFYEINSPALEYDAVAQRSGSRGGSRATEVLAGSNRGTPSKGRAGNLPLQRSSNQSARQSCSLDKENSSRSLPRERAGIAGREADGVKKTTGRTSGDKTAAAKHDEGLRQKAEMLNQENAQLQATVEGLEKERDFYFEKLTQVEELLQERQSAGESTDLITQIFKILYATGEAAPAASASHAEV